METKELNQGDFGWRANKGPNPLNTSGFSAAGHRVLLLGKQKEEVTAGGIVLPQKAIDATQNLQVTAVVVEIGHDAWADKSTDYAQVGDEVLVGQYVGKFETSEVDGLIYRFVNDLDILSKITRKKTE